MKAALLAFEGCSLWQMGQVNQSLTDAGIVIRTLTPGGNKIRLDGQQWLLADSALEPSAAFDYTIVLVPGGRYTPTVAENPHAIRFLRQADSHHAWILATGQGVGLLATAGLLGGLQVAIDDECEQLYSYRLQNVQKSNQVLAVHGNILSAHAHAGASMASWFYRHVLLNDYLKKG
ncbi:DJ-1/PfpI family protein [Alicyclobacillus tolerans]|uniref:Intracellular protease/amidase n=2 Tax=Alicyclobacillus tolerans TaxID=90970 RepID=A0ABT9LTN0_9BACL|nr:MULTISPECIES: DJ-1/PfpI family protein [Alicyclobacillus]MDP9727613.1 putative intracellular protease/amidase [Alicyclobacillus tengchongensis]SHJ64413.1 DJ-1/PfpI family protein [Alicyclobacillus montanus]